MRIIDVENMTAEQIKAQRAECVAAAAAAEDVAQRYVQARLDAAMRDAKLAEQGETIKSMQQQAQAIVSQNQGLQASLRSAQQVVESRERIIGDKETHIASLEAELKEERTRRAHGEQVSKARRSVLAKLQSMIAEQLVAE